MGNQVHREWTWLQQTSLQTAVKIHLSPQMAGAVCRLLLSFRFHNLLEMAQQIKRTTQTQHISVIIHIQQTYYNRI